MCIHINNRLVLNIHGIRRELDSLKPPLPLKSQGHMMSTATLGSARSSNESSSFLCLPSSRARSVPAAARWPSASLWARLGGASVTAGRNSRRLRWPPM
uniref:Uncharacterized protein n=1 Tax=Zea mays TaxID=4577 RepID=C4J6P2_MAIZE|nr:unknown [Zea mays]